MTPRNDNQFKDLYRYLRSHNVPAKLAKDCADIVASETADDIPRTREKQHIVTAAWNIANGGHPRIVCRGLYQ